MLAVSVVRTQQTCGNGKVTGGARPPSGMIYDGDKLTSERTDIDVSIELMFG